ncbi:peptidoglycan-binding protein [Pyxidicoccus sp. 3LFB2]
MGRRLGLGDTGPEVQRLQELLTQWGYPPGAGGDFDEATRAAVVAFQAQHLDFHGEPLVVDGMVGPLTWWSLTNPQPLFSNAPVIDFTRMPLPELGGSARGRHALAMAIEELKAGAGEEGGPNAGPWIRKYLNGQAPEGNAWCAGFVSWCFWQDPGGPPFPYTVSARKLLGELGQRGWAHLSGERYLPQPGDLVVWSRVDSGGREDHVGLVHHVAYGMLYTVEGSHAPRVQGFSYELSHMERLLGYAQVPGP